MRDLVRGRPGSHGARQAPLRGTMASKIGARLGLIVLLRRSRSDREQGPISVRLVLSPKLGIRDCPCIGHGRGRRVRWETGE